MADLLELSTRIIDSGIANEPTNRISHELSELGDQIAIVEAFSHSVLFRTDDGLVVFDTSGIPSGKRVVEAIRGWSTDRFNTLVYTHGHIDHVGGCGAFLADVAERSDPQVRDAFFAEYRRMAGEIREQQADALLIVAADHGHIAGLRGCLHRCVGVDVIRH